MRDLTTLDQYRDRSPRVMASFGSYGDATCGVFNVRSPVDQQTMHVVAATGLGWDHVSVSRQRRTPTWGELEHVKRLFFNDDEIALQFHVPSDQHINLHAYCLHLWRPTDVAISLPPSIMV